MKNSLIVDAKDKGNQGSFPERSVNDPVTMARRRVTRCRASGEVAADPLSAPDMSSLADLSAGHQVIEAMRPVPVSKQCIVPLELAALLPFVVVAATQAPFRQILGSIKGLLFL